MTPSPLSFGKRVHTLSSAKKEGRTVLHICKDMRSYVKGIDSYLSKIKSARDRISNLLEELDLEIESIVSKKEISWNTEESALVEEMATQMGLDQHGTNLQEDLEKLQVKGPSLKDATDTLKRILEVGTSPDLRCYETISPSCPLPKGLTFLSGGTMVNLGQESLVELSKNSPQLIEKMLELSGGMDTCFNESA